MAWAVGSNAGSANNKTSGTTIAMTISANAAVGDTVVIVTVANNLTTVSGDSTDHSITDSEGNTYTRAKEGTQSSGSAADGVTLGVFFTRVTTALTASSSTITLTIASAVTAKVMLALLCTGAADPSVAGAVATPGASSSPSCTLSGLPNTNERLWIGVVGVENPSVAILGGDADYTNSATVGTTGGSAVSNVAFRRETRIASISSDTWSGTLDASLDWVAILVALDEGAPVELRPQPVFQHQAVQRAASW